jgi:hypothetical protein
MRLLQKSRGLRLNGQNPLKSPFFLAVLFNQWKGFENCWKTFTQKGQRLAFKSFGSFR